VGPAQGGRVDERQRAAEVRSGGDGAAQQRRGPQAAEQFDGEVGLADVVQRARHEAQAGEGDGVLGVAHGPRPRYQSAGDGRAARSGRVVAVIARLAAGARPPR
jgi:hypothetical protein